MLVSPSSLTTALGWTLKAEGPLPRRRLRTGPRSRRTASSGELARRRRGGERARTPVGRRRRRRSGRRRAAAASSAATRSQMLVAPDFELPDLDGAPHTPVGVAGHRSGCSTPSPPGEAAATTCPGGRPCTTSSPTRTSSSSRSRSTSRADDVRPWTEGITLPVLHRSRAPAHRALRDQQRARPSSGSTRTTASCGRTASRSPPTCSPSSPARTPGRTSTRCGRGCVTAWRRSRPTKPRAAVPDLSDDEVRARLHFRIATEARRHGDDDIARRHFVRAGELAPTDFTIRRAAMPLMGGDPFGAGVHGALPGVGASSGSPFHGLQPMTD